MHHMHQWYLATSRQKTKAWICTTSIPSWTHWFLSFVRVSLRVVTSLSNPGVWDLTHWSQQARWGAARRAGPGQTVWDLPRSSEFVPPGTVELLIQHGRQLKVCTATMQPNARQVLLPAGDRSLIEACLACELHLKVLWHGWSTWAEWKCPFSCQIYNSTRLQDDAATSWPSFAWSHCEIEHLPLDDLTGWPSSGRDGQVLADKWCTSDAFLLEFASARFHGIFFARDLQAQEEGPFQFLKSSQAMAGGGRRMKKTRQTTDIKWPLWQHLWHLLKRLWLLQDGLVSSHVPSLQKLHPLKQNRSSVDMEFFQWKWEHGVHTVHTPFFEYGVYFVRVGRSTSWIRGWAESHTGWNSESGKHASKSGNYWKLVETELP